MDHKFEPSQLDATKCRACKYGFLEHTALCQCTVCPNVDTCNIINGILMCKDCEVKEHVAIAARQAEKASEVVARPTGPLAHLITVDMSPEAQQARVDEVRALHVKHENERLEQAQIIDGEIETVGDLFLADTVSIIDLKKIIEEDAAIPADKKAFTLATQLTTRFNHLKQVLFEFDKKRMELAQNQRDIQVYLNQLGNKLREEEREKIKLQDMSYNPAKAKPARAKSNRKTFDKAELTKYAKELDVPASTLQMLCVKRNWQPKQAYEFMKAQLA